MTTITYLVSNNATYVRIQLKSTILARLCRRTTADKRSRAMGEVPVSAVVAETSGMKSAENEDEDEAGR